MHMKKHQRAGRLLLSKHKRPRKHFNPIHWRNMPLRIMEDFQEQYWDKMRLWFPNLPPEVLCEITMLACCKLAEEACDEE